MRDIRLRRLRRPRAPLLSHPLRSLLQTLRCLGLPQIATFERSHNKLALSAITNRSGIDSVDATFSSRFLNGIRRTQRIGLAYHLPETACAADPNTRGSPVKCLSPLIQWAGISNRHPIPSEAKTRSTVPPSSNGISSRIMLVP
jgi:hypothetical protein